MKRLALFLPLCLMSIGCVRSLHPFYLDSQLTYDPQLEGSWTDADQKESFVVTGDAERKQYKVVYTDKESKTAGFVVHLARVQGKMLADVFPDEPKIDASDVYKAYLVPVHSFFLVEYDPNSIHLKSMSNEWLQKVVLGAPGVIKHERIGEEVILTAQPQEAQDFIFKNLTTADAWGDDTEFRRAPATQPATMPAGK